MGHAILLELSFLLGVGGNRDMHVGRAQALRSPGQWADAKSKGVGGNGQAVLFVAAGV